ncbi:aminoglycoside phosphotransferase family protein [Paenibacillus ginsengarvi]|uniref:Aminoglycoside phosphotransferase family protein n=1 Tax=Paenibacillus ginsengarvi TaxID=400777 RepID=A0A3B0ATZ9_9BACL|nr:aminoglycoside phosphotransferase family protein [Paenibacillus ginsengarvi]RKN64059.1 aminoglycoside phosphotransferase family protein [Paenibacillus ginsengarvi]
MNELDLIMQQAVRQHISHSANIISVEPRAIQLGFQAQEVQRFQVKLQIDQSISEVYLVNKKADLKERRVLNLLQSQAAKVPLSYSNDYFTDAPQYICMQDIDYNTDYGSIDLKIVEKQAGHALAHIHGSNYRLADRLAWLPTASRAYVSHMLEKWWLPNWEKAKRNDQFVEHFRPYIPDIEAASASIADDMERVICDESSNTLIHTDLHPGNVLCSSSNEVYFIDWADAHYGSFYFDVPLRFDELDKAQIYRETLEESFKINVHPEHFAAQFRTASRYIGIRYISWTFGDWHTSPSTMQALQSYLNRIVN